MRVVQHARSTARYPRQSRRISVEQSRGGYKNSIPTCKHWFDYGFIFVGALKIFKVKRFQKVNEDKQVINEKTTAVSEHSLQI